VKHGEIRDYLKRELGLGHGDANALVHAVLSSDGARSAQGKDISDVLDEIYSGPRAAFRPVHEELIKQISTFGEFETAPKKGYVSLRRRKQFAMLGPATNTRFELGINAKDLPAQPRLVEQRPGSMCNYIVRLSDPAEVDPQLIGWLRTAFESAG
jgi:hypothetical protein